MTSPNCSWLMVDKYPEVHLQKVLFINRSSLLCIGYSLSLISQSLQANLGAPNLGLGAAQGFCGLFRVIWASLLSLTIRKLFSHFLSSKIP